MIIVIITTVIIIMIMVLYGISEFRLELMYISIAKSIRSNPIHISGFACACVIVFICNSRIGIATKGLLKLSNLVMLNKAQKSVMTASLFLSFSELQIAFSTKGHILFMFFLIFLWSCCLHLISQNCLLKSFQRTLLLMALIVSCLLLILEPI